jgi:hypothetical protein
MWWKPRTPGHFHRNGYSFIERLILGHFLEKLDSAIWHVHDRDPLPCTRPYLCTLLARCPQGWNRRKELKLFSLRIFVDCTHGMPPVARQWHCFTGRISHAQAPNGTSCPRTRVTHSAASVGTARASKGLSEIWLLTCMQNVYIIYYIINLAAKPIPVELRGMLRPI